MELIKNNRFRTGTMVDIYHSPCYEGYTIALEDATVAGNYQVLATFPDDISLEMFGVGDIAAFGFGAGEIVAKTQYTITVDFPTSMFAGSDVMSYVGLESRHVLIFLEAGRVETNFAVAQYNEVVNQATYGYSKAIYNLELEADLILTPIRMVDDGTISNIMYSTGHVLKSCNIIDYEVTAEWDSEFPVEFSGSSTDPIYRRAFLKKRELTAKRGKIAAKMEFKLIG